MVLEERGKPEFPEKNLQEQSREPTNSTHIGDAGSRNCTWDTLVEGELPHHCANPAPDGLVSVSTCKLIEQTGPCTCTNNRETLSTSSNINKEPYTLTT